MFEAGSGTTSGALEILTMALLLFPEVRAEAQKELDAENTNVIRFSM